MIDRRQLLMAGAATFMLPYALRAGGVRLDAAYVNGSVWTGVRGAPLASAFGTVGNRIAAVGKDQVAASTGPMTRVVDLGGAFVTPGIIDNHTHFLMGSQALSRVNLRQASTPAEFSRIIAEAAQEVGSGKWVEGGNWDEQLWGGELPHKDWIDAVTPNTPVAVARLDLHMWFLNSLALKLAGIDRNTPDPDGGVIIRDANGEPTGIVKDKAKDLVQRVIPEPSEAEIEATFRKGIEHGLSLGVTQVHIKALDWTSQNALRRMRAKGETDMRFSSFVPLQDWAKLDAIVREEGRGDDWVRWGGLKGLVDGSLGSGTALFKEPYSDMPENKGITFVDPADLREWVLAADKHNLHIAVHAIGDRANDMILDIYAEAEAVNGARDRRFLIEHAQHISPASIPRFAELGVVASVQPYHAVDDGRWAVKKIGKERLHGTYAFGSLLDAGVKVSFGSDWPVAPLDPRTGLQAAVLRQTIDGANPEGWLPDEKISIEAALEAYTVTNAYAGFQEDRFGMLAPGYVADFVVFADNLLTMDPAHLTEVEILRTIVDGTERYSSDT
ncbi:amidohydrolase [Kordiimonas pumila]|uniref:Amidohydrolase n=1 Tax=Kordiimonas pumila TaxID=2161677 RepID=A0ABV7D424_9PROT|nr:amidohydrolase [Kordiimonas pumila]